MSAACSGMFIGNSSIYLCQVAILLKDVNDRTPVFQFRDYQSEVSEDSPVGTTVTTLAASDMDSPDNTVVKPLNGYQREFESTYP